MSCSVFLENHGKFRKALLVWSGECLPPEKGVQVQDSSILLLQRGEASLLELTELSRAQEVVARLKDRRLTE